MRRYYVVVMTKEECYPLSNERKTLKECKDSISWQRKGGFDTRQMFIAAFNPESGEFETVQDSWGNAHNVKVTMSRGAFTEDAFARITKELKGV